MIFAVEQPLFAEELQSENEQSVILLQGDELLAAESTTKDLAQETNSTQTGANAALITGGGQLVVRAVVLAAAVAGAIAITGNNSATSSNGSAD